MDSEFTDDIRPQWAGRVPRWKVRRLYEADAAGFMDEALVSEVGIGLLLRCKSILIATEAHDGRAMCPRCESEIPHKWKKDQIVSCPGCEWETTWGAYLHTYQDKQLVGGGAMHAFEAYVEEYPRASTYRERMLLIDYLIHVFHYELIGKPTRPAACNVIGGSITEVTEFLDTLTYGRGSSPGIREEREARLEKADKASKYVGAVLANALKRRGRSGD